MRRAYHYVFGATPAPADASTQENGTTQEEHSKAPEGDDVGPAVPAKENGVASPSTDVGTLQKQLEDSMNAVESQEVELESLRKETDALKEDFKLKEAALLQQKTALEEHMVSVVVQQIQDARKAEREATATEVKGEYQASLVSCLCLAR